MKERMRGIMLFDFDYTINVGTLLVICFGWFIILNGAKYIASRSECKSVLESKNKLLQELLQESYSFWLTYEPELVAENQSFMQRSSFKVGLIREYLNVLNLYQIKVNVVEICKTLKDVTTSSPEREIRTDRDSLIEYRCDKARASKELLGKLVLDDFNTFAGVHKPVNSPLINKFIFIIVLVLVTGYIFI